jgi:hypothetical protein
MPREFRSSLIQFKLFVSYPLQKKHKTFLQEKAVEATKQKKEGRRKKPKPEEQEGMPQHQHCPPSLQKRSSR